MTFVAILTGSEPDLPVMHEAAGGSELLVAPVTAARAATAMATNTLWQVLGTALGSVEARARRQQGQAHAGTRRTPTRHRH